MYQHALLYHKNVLNAMAYWASSITLPNQCGEVLICTNFPTVYKALYQHHAEYPETGDTHLLPTHSLC